MAECTYRYSYYQLLQIFFVPKILLQWRIQNFMLGGGKNEVRSKKRSRLFKKLWKNERFLIIFFKMLIKFSK